MLNEKRTIMPYNFEKYSQEANGFINNLATDLGYPEEKGRAAFVLRSVLHTLRDRITISESLNLLAQFPFFMKAIYVDGWKYRDKPERIKSLDEFIEKVNENNQLKFDDDYLSYVIDEEMVRITLASLRPYVSEGESEDILSQLPEEIRSLFSYFFLKRV
jgi:uncharacterized protein (DUF2267 family)